MVPRPKMCLKVSVSAVLVACSVVVAVPGRERCLIRKSGVVARGGRERCLIRKSGVVARGGRERCLIRKSGVVARGGRGTSCARGMEDRCSQLCGYSCGRESVSQRCEAMQQLNIQTHCFRKDYQNQLWTSGWDCCRLMYQPKETHFSAFV